MMTAFYNEIDPAAAHVLECLIKDKIIADGVVDRRSISDIDPRDLEGFTQVHLFAGGGLWSVAARMAGWPDDRELWTGSCPCQPFSVAGKGLAEDDPRHLWPDFFRLIHARRPPVVFGEQVSGAAGLRWFDGVADDLEGADYACEAFNLSACSVNAPHIRQRLYWCAVEQPDRARQQYGGEMQTGRGLNGAGAGDHRAAGCAGGGDLEHAARVGRREGRAEHEFRSRRGPAPGAGRSVVADAHKPRLEGRELSAERADKQPFRQDCLADASGSGRGRWAEDPKWLAERGNAAERVGGDMADADCTTRQQDAGSAFGDEEAHGRTGRDQCEQNRDNGFAGYGEGGFWSSYEWRTGADGKSRRVKPGIRLLVDGYVNRVSALRIAGNAIVPQVAAEVIRAFMESHDEQ